eukprot:SAG31_NODE_2891_length_4944_cov_2.014035_5_plen_74_part_01
MHSHAGHFYSGPAGGGIPCNVGVADMPLTKAKWREIGESIIGSSSKAAGARLRAWLRAAAGRGRALVLVGVQLK